MSWKEEKVRVLESDKKNIKDGVITGMDYLIQNKIYSFQPGKIIINKNLSKIIQYLFTL